VRACDGNLATIDVGRGINSACADVDEVENTNDTPRAFPMRDMAMIQGLQGTPEGE